MARVLILAGGAPPYTDPWHPFAETATALAGVLGDSGHAVEISHDLVERLANLSDVDVLISNAPSPTEDLDPVALDTAADSLAGFCARNAGIMGLHVGVTTLLGIPLWSELMGVRWVADRTMHPPLGPARVRVRSDARVMADGGEFEVFDELYSFLGVSAPIEPLVEHDLNGETHPLVWARDVDGLRVVGNALGHSARSLESSEHATLIASSVRWLARETG